TTDCLLIDSYSHEVTAFFLKLPFPQILKLCRIHHRIITVRNILVNNKEYTVSEMIVPFESLTVPVTTIHSNDEITISYISDFGGIISKPVVFDK
ncbi:hypothetical protein Q4S19_10840, partial [Morganella morganii]